MAFELVVLPAGNGLEAVPEVEALDTKGFRGAGRSAERTDTQENTKMQMQHEETQTNPQS